MELPDLTLENVVELGAGLGALNWLLDSSLNTNLVTELLGSGNAELGYLAIGVAGAITISERLELTEIYDGA